MKLLSGFLFLSCLSIIVAAEIPPAPDAVFRAPFTLRLRVDEEHFYEQKIERRIPYVQEDSVILFCGEHFGVKISKGKDQIAHLAYEPDEKAADLILAFRQEKINDGWSTILELENRTQDKLAIGATMVVLNRKGSIPTNLLPLHAGTKSYEMWPHPIVQLVLHDIRMDKEAPKQPTKPTAKAAARQ